MVVRIVFDDNCLDDASNQRLHQDTIRRQLTHGMR
jgi:hypothetical protein